MSVYACSQEVVITGDGGVTQSAGADGDGGPKTRQLICLAADDGNR